MEEILEEIPERAMAVFAHPADAEIACGATVARWIRAGCEVSLIICARGDKGSHEPDADPAHVAATRLSEVDAAVEVLGFDHHELLGWEDGEVTNSSALRAALVGQIRARRPEVVFSHDPTAVFIGSGYINHRDHREVGFAVCDAVAPAAGSPLYFPDEGEPHRVSTLLLSGTLQPDCWVDVEGCLEAKVTALQCHRSQLAGNESGVDAVVRERALEGRDRVGIDVSEGFRRIRLAM